MHLGDNSYNIVLCYHSCTGAMVDILNHYDFDNRVSVTSELCEGLLGCSDGKNSDL